MLVSYLVSVPVHRSIEESADAKGLISTLSNALYSQPFPSPLGALNPPTGRYEGAVLGLGALGAQAIRSTLWGNGGDALGRIDDLVVTLYPDGKRGKMGLVKATMVS